MKELWQIHDNPEYYEKFVNGEIPVGHDEFCHTLVTKGDGRRYFHCNVCGYVKKDDVVPENAIYFSHCKCGAMVIHETYSDAEYEHFVAMQNVER